MKELSDVFTGKGEVKGFIFTKLRGSEKCYLYEVKTPSTSNRDSSTHWEVFERKETKDGIATIGGMSVVFEAKVLYPNSKNFGIWAWHYGDLQKAEDKYHELNKTPIIVK